MPTPTLKARRLSQPGRVLATLLGAFLAAGGVWLLLDQVHEHLAAGAPLPRWSEVSSTLFAIGFGALGLYAAWTGRDPFAAKATERKADEPPPPAA
jgi:hypothetical protein